MIRFQPAGKECRTVWGLFGSQHLLHQPVQLGAGEQHIAERPADDLTRRDAQRRLGGAPAGCRASAGMR